MWRARSDGDEQPSRGREARPGTDPRSEHRRSLDDWPDDSPGDDDPRSELTGRKIRRIESGPPGAVRDRSRPGQTLARRQPSAAASDDTELGGSPNGRPGRHIGRPPSPGEASSWGEASSAGDATSAGAGGGLGGLGSLPPLRQPTGEQPVVPDHAESDDRPVPSTRGTAGEVPTPFPAPAGGVPVEAETVADATPDGSNGASGFDDLEADRLVDRVNHAVADLADDRSDTGRGLPSEAPSLPGPAPAAASGGGPVPDQPAPPEPPSSGVFGDGGADDRSLDPTMPSMAADRPGPASPRPPERNRSGEMPSVFDDPIGGGDGLGPAAGLGAGSPWGAGEAPAASSSSFPSADDGHPSTAAFPSWSGAMADAQRTDDPTLAMGPGGRDRPSHPAGGGFAGGGAGRHPDFEERSPFDTSSSYGAGVRTPGGGSSSQRLQETEIKLAGRQERPQKPQEPNRLLLGLALAVVVLAGAGVAWWLTRDDGSTVEEATTDTTVAETAGTDAQTTDTQPAPATQEPILDVPELSLVGIEPGPLDPSVTYSIELVGEAPGSMLQVVVDDVPQGQPDPVLPDLILPPGRHTLAVAVTNGAEIKTSTPVDVYVLGEPPAAGAIANLASIDMTNEGWAEAVRRFDEFRDAGHQNLQLLPITPGYWNIFVAGLGQDLSAVNAYCESFGLAMPDECFAKTFDPATYTGPTASAGAAGQADDGEDSGAMTDQGGDTTTTTGG